jgi:hypothetical protein
MTCSVRIWRAPSVNSETERKAALAKRWLRKLDYFRRIPARRREAECADEGEAICRASLRELDEKFIQ